MVCIGRDNVPLVILEIESGDPAKRIILIHATYGYSNIDEP